MAISSLRPSPPWTNKDIVIEAYKGFHMNYSWNGRIKSNNNPDRKPIDDEERADRIATLVFSNLFTTFCEFEKRLSSTAPTHYGQEFIPNPLGPYFYGALLLAVLNMHKIRTEYELNKLPELEPDSGVVSKIPPPHIPYIPSNLDYVAEVVWQATPYLMVITNVALTVLEIRNGDKKAWIKLIVTGVTLIDITSWKPNAFNWYLTVFARYPIDTAKMYYSDATAALAALNAMTIVRNQKNKNDSAGSSHKNTGVWKMTPYVMLITNIALIIIAIPRNKVIGLTSLAAFGITLIDLTSWKPKDFGWYLDVGVRVPLDLAVMYYYEDKRISSLISLAMDPLISQTIDNCIKRLSLV